MARLTPEQWERARADYEVSGNSLRDVAKEYCVSPSTVARRAEKENWIQGKTQHLVAKKKNAIKELHETQQQTQHLNATLQIAIDTEVQKQLEDEQIFINAAKYNQMVANELLQSDDDLSMTTIDTHSRLTHRNKVTVLGKEPDTAIQNNEYINVGDSADKMAGILALAQARKDASRGD